MKNNYWIDKESESNNVIAVSSNAIFVASIDKEHVDDVNNQLVSGTNPIEVFGTDGMLIIPHNMIQNIVSRNTDEDVDIKYKTKKDIEDKSIHFVSLDAKASFIDALSTTLPDTLIKKVTQQNVIVAAINPLISLLIGLGLIFLFFNKLRWLAIIVGGLWAIGSAFMLFKRLTSPPEISRWSIKGKHFRKAWSGVKMGFSYLVLAGIVYSIYAQFSDVYGPKSIIQHVYNDELNSQDIAKFMQRGADINARDENGDTVLYNAMAFDNSEVTLELINQGADVNLSIHDDGTPTSPLEYALYSENQLDVVRALLVKGASVDITIDDESVIDWVREYNGSDELIELLQEFGAK